MLALLAEGVNHLHHWALFAFPGPMRRDHERALTEAELALELDPLSVLIRSHFAWVHLGLGENHAALDWLETAYAKHNTNVLFLRCVSFYDPLRSEPRYHQLLARLPLLPRAGSQGS